MEKREPDDPGRYLLAIWTPGEETICIKQIASGQIDKIIFCQYDHRIDVF